MLGGSFSEVQAIKVGRLLEMATAVGAPIVALLDSVGARIQEGIWSLAGFGDLFWRNTQASGVVPQISVMLGPCAGGAVYSPGLTDFVVMVRGTSYMFITGPDVIRTVTGEEVDAETLGGADAHAARSGVAHFVAESERARSRWFAGCSVTCRRTTLRIRPRRRARATAPELGRARPRDPASTLRQAYDVRDVIALIADPESFLEVHADFAQNAVVGFARLRGRVVAFVANQPAYLAGVLDIDASDKIARFIRFADAFNIPIVTLVDCPGFLPGAGQEHHGIIRHGAKIVYAYSEATVPKISVVLRKAYGGAYIVMGSKMIRTDLCFAWPTAEIAVMGPKGAVSILYARQLAALTGRAREVERTRLEAGVQGAVQLAVCRRLDGIHRRSDLSARNARAAGGRPRLPQRQAGASLPRKHGNIPL